ncbi:hypothetical protein VCR4J2_280023 [Vibrio coralliirubri]|nr:hypothetical protein VCR4J2_280023 [Vibrio coralliirubri]
MIDLTGYIDDCTNELSRRLHCPKSSNKFSEVDDFQSSLHE